MTGSEEVEAYIAALPKDRQGPMKTIRKIVANAAPDADEVIAYKMPALRLKDRFFMSYDAFKGHYSLFPSTDAMIQELGDAITPHVKGKGTLQFRADEPLPEKLIRRVVEIRLREFR
jgi:uncharacterized protein YdhG (YjbR/CyaY superfamily)